jgi:hypothetical protein
MEPLPAAAFADYAVRKVESRALEL